MIESNFYSLLSSNPSIAGIAGPRIYPLVLPDSPTLPAIHYALVGGSMQQGVTTSGLRRYRIEVNCWGNTYSDAVSLRDAVVSALDGYSDANMSILLIQPTDFFEHELLQYRAMCEFYVFTSL